MRAKTTDVGKGQPGTPKEDIKDASNAGGNGQSISESESAQEAGGEIDLQADSSNQWGAKEGQSKFRLGFREWFS